MATMSVQLRALEAVEQNTDFVGSGLAMAERMKWLSKFCFSLFTLTIALHKHVEEQSSLLRDLKSEQIVQAPKDFLVALSMKLESIVERNERILGRAMVADWHPIWKEMLGKLRAQNEAFDSLVESFRMSASEEFRRHVADLVTAAGDESAAKDESWRDFVGSLQD